MSCLMCCCLFQKMPWALNIEFHKQSAVHLSPFIVKLFLLMSCWKHDVAFPTLIPRFIFIAFKKINISPMNMNISVCEKKSLYRTLCIFVNKSIQHIISGKTFSRKTRECWVSRQKNFDSFQIFVKVTETLK